MVESFYDLEDGEAAKALVQRLSAPRLGFVRPTPVNLKTFEEKRKTDQLLKIGGPGRIVVMAGSVLVTERNGRFCRILGTGRHTLQRFELPRTLLDLSPQEREAENIKMMTSDGIEVTFDNLTVTFQIDRGKDKPTRENPFPYDEVAVRKAAYTDTNEGNGSVGMWDGLPMLILRGQLTMTVAEYRLDELIVSESNVNIHKRLQKEMERRAKAILGGFGIAIRGTRLGALELTEPVKKQRKEFWQARGSAQQILQRADGEAEVLQSREIARAEAEAIMLRAIAEGLQRSKLTGSGASSREIVALRLIESLEEMARKSQEVVPLPDQLIPQLDSLRQQLMITAGEIEEAKGED
jgi:regulator of protease activity HflC (stomatin/prohibitin superfamily)